MSLGEAQIVPQPFVFPMACLCGNQKGPILDTMMEKAGLRIYVCRSCAKDIARSFGFADGAELDKLMDARQLLDNAEAAAVRQSEQVTGLTAKIVELKAEVEEAREDARFARGEAENLKHIARAIEASTSELVGASGSEAT